MACTDLSREDIVGDPLNKVGAVLALNILHLFFDFFHGDLATEVGSNLYDNSRLSLGTNRVISTIQSDSDHDEDRKPPSCSWHRTFVG